MPVACLRQLSFATTARRGRAVKVAKAPPSPVGWVLVAAVLVVLGAGGGLAGVIGQPRVAPSPSKPAATATVKPKPPVARSSPPGKHWLAFRGTWITVPKHTVSIQVAIAGVPLINPVYQRLSPWAPRKRYEYDGFSRVVLVVQGYNQYERMWVACEIYHYRPGEAEPEITKKPAKTQRSQTRINANLVATCEYSGAE